jgi:hypothetical protein
MDEDAFKLLARIAALELLLGKLFALVYLSMQMNRDDIMKGHRTLRSLLSTEALVKTNDPALSDLYSAEIEAQIDRFLLGVEKELLPRLVGWLTKGVEIAPISLGRVSEPR